MGSTIRYRERLHHIEERSAFAYNESYKRLETTELRDVDEVTLTFNLALTTAALLPPGNYLGHFVKSNKLKDQYCYQFYPYTLYLKDVSTQTENHWVGDGYYCE